MDLIGFGWDDWAMTNPDTFRPKARFAIAAVLMLQSVLLAWQITLMGDEHSGLIAAAAFVAANTAIWLLFVRPKIVFFDEGLTIVNPLTEVTIPWLAVDELDSQLAFSVRAGGKKFSAWAAPAPGRQHSRTLHSSEFKGLGLADGRSMRLSDSPRSGLESFKELGGDKSASPAFKFNYLGTALMVVSILTLTLLVA
ncbi:MAG: hypothetical protein RLZZ90_1062 [Actinomycetota bacterium]